MQGPALTVIIPTRDRPDLLASCLDRLLGEVGADDEVIVIDSASRSTEVREVAEARGVRYLRSEVAGTSRARNLGWQAASHEVVAMIDDDVLVESGWADALRTSFADPSTHFVAGRIDPDDPDAEGLRSTKTDPEPQRLTWENAQHHSLGCNAAVRRSALAAVGGFDERLGGGHFFSGEDVEILDRLVGLELAGQYEPAARVTHVQHGTSADRLRAQWYYGLGTGARCALVWKRDRRRFPLVSPDILRIGGVKTVASAPEPGKRREIAGPIAFRLGGVVGFAAGLAGLRRATKSLA